MQKITPCLWFNDQAEEAMTFYTSLFENLAAPAGESKIEQIKRYPDEPVEEFMNGMAGKVLTGIFVLAGQRFMALDGGPQFTFTPAVSFIVNCGTKDEVDALWEPLSEGGSVLMPLDTYPFSERYGWLHDRYGLSWQLILAEEQAMPKIIPSMLFVGDVCGKAEEAIHFYVSLFNDAKVGAIHRYGPDQKPDEEGTVMFADFMLEGQWFAAMDSAQDHDFTFNEAISFSVECETQEEVDAFWEKLSAVPASEQCGWLKDQYGISWQIIPKQLGELMSDPDPEKAGRVMEAMLKMKKIDVAGLENAYAG